MQKLDLPDNLNFAVLRRFLELARELHFTRAAENVGIAQPLLSEQIKGLETALGLKLFKRTSRRVELTIAGQVFRERVHLIVEGMQDSVIATKAAAVGEEGRLRIGYTDEFASELLPSAVSQVRRQHPSSQVELVLDLTPHLAEQLRTGLLDVALTCPIPEDSFDSGFRFTMLPPLPLCVALPLGHRLAASEAVKIAALKNEPFILGPVQSASERVFDRLFAQLGAQRKVVQRVPDTELLMSLVAEGIGIMIGYFGEQNMARNDLIIVPLREQDAQLSRALIWRNTYSNKLLEEFLRYFNAVGGDGMLGADTHGTTQGNEAQSGNPVTPSVGE